MFDRWQYLYNKVCSLFPVVLGTVLPCVYSDLSSDFDLEESKAFANREFNLPTMLRGS